MGPKVLAAAEFAERTDGFAAIGALQDAEAIMAGRRGTRVVREIVTA
jgi:carbamate kinase